MSFGYFLKIFYVTRLQISSCWTICFFILQINCTYRV